MDPQQPSLARLRNTSLVLVAVGVSSVAVDLWRQTQGVSLAWTSWASGMLYVFTGLLLSQVVRMPQSLWRLASFALAGAWTVLLAAKVAAKTP